ncbi:hypothetical protein [Achromobacter insolitus]|uniref:hypothetical protein n=1 Tax=Achromobacter insolitus TaxID=217204 RepID=UPI002FE21530
MAALDRHSLAVLLLCAASAPAVAQDCVAQVQAKQARIDRAQDVQRTREASNDLQLNRELCQGRLDLLDARYALVDDFEACRRKGVEFPAKMARALSDASEELADKKAAWIRTCGPQMKD